MMWTNYINRNSIITIMLPVDSKLSRPENGVMTYEMSCVTNVNYLSIVCNSFWKVTCFSVETINIIYTASPE